MFENSSKSNTVKHTIFIIMSVSFVNFTNTVFEKLFILYIYNDKITPKPPKKKIIIFDGKLLTKTFMDNAIEKNKVQLCAHIIVIGTALSCLDTATQEFCFMF